MPYFTAVVSSARYWPKPPSPVTATTGRSGVGRPGAHRCREAEADRARGSPTSAPTGRRGLEVAAERVGVVADVDADHGVVGADARPSASNTAADDDAPAPVVGDAPRLLGPPDRPARGDVGALVDRRRRPRAARRSSAASGDADVAEHAARSRGGTGRWRPGRRRPARSACTSAMPVWLENEAPTTISRSDSFISQLATGVPRAAEHAGAERVVVGDQALGLERGEHGGAQRARPASRTCRHRGAGAVARRRSPVAGPPRSSSAAAASSASGAGPTRRSASRPSGPPAPCVGRQRPAPRRAGPGGRRRGRRRACLTASVGQLGVVASRPAPCRSRPATSPNAAVRSRSWNAPAAEHLRRAPGRRWRAPAHRSTLASYSPVSRLVDPGPAMAKQAAGRPVSLP